MEERTLLTDFTASLPNELPSNNPLFPQTLRGAIAQANVNPGSDRVILLPGLTYPVLSELRITDNVEIYGTGSESLGPSLFTITASNRDHRVLNIDDGTTTRINVTINGVTITGGGDGTANEQGAGIFSAEDLTIRNSHVTGNDAGGAVAGGVLTFDGDLTVINSVFSDNQAEQAGAIWTQGTGELKIINSTISGNSAHHDGGGVIMLNSTTIRNSTITGNRSDSDGTNGGSGGGIFPDPNTTTMYNTIVAGNFVGTGADPSDIAGSLIAGSSNNLVGDSGSRGGLNHDPRDGSGDGRENIVGNSGSGTIPIGSILDTTLQLNGGLTETHALVADSSAIDAGDNGEAIDENGAALTTDQRVFPVVLHPRIRNGNLDATATVDIGSFEAVLFGPYVVDTDADAVDGDYSANNLSLREAIHSANLSSGFDEITFLAGLDPIILGGTELPVTDSVRITGPAEVNANQLSRILNIASTAGAVTLSDLTLKNGQAPADEPGGAILSNSPETLIITDSTISGSEADGKGGGVRTLASAVNISGSTISQNQSGTAGGGVDADSGGTITNSTLSGNFSGDIGGGLAAGNSVTVINSTIAGNESVGDGGGLWVFGGDVRVVNSTLSGNTSGDNGGAAFIRDTVGTLTIHNSILAGNTGSPADVSSQAEIEDVKNSVIGDNTGLGLPTDGTNNNLVDIDWKTVLLNDGTEPTLAPNGGPTQTIALTSNSPAIDAGDNAIALDAGNSPLTTDQRGAGFNRRNDADMGGDIVDIGAFESTAFPLIVSTMTDVSDGNFADGELSLREAIELSNNRTRADDITFSTTLKSAGLWNFNGNLDNARDSTMPVSVNGSQSVTFTSETIDGIAAQVADIPAFSGQANNIQVPNPIGSNGGGIFTNEYTLVMDVNFPTFPGTGSFASLLQTNQSNQNDVDVYVDSNGRLGFRSGRVGSAVIDANIWYRLAIVNEVSGADLVTSLYLNGVLIGSANNGAIDGTYSLDDTFFVFSDDNGDTVQTKVNSLALFSHPLPSREIATLGGATADGLPQLIDRESPLLIELTNGQLELTDSVTITGPGADMLTVDANGGSRIFEIDDGILDPASVNISGLTLTGGMVNSAGGAIRSQENLTLSGVVITGNESSLQGGGVYNRGILLLKDSEISDNDGGNNGGGLFLDNPGSATIVNTTISGNRSARWGGGIASDDTLTIYNSTITLNQADSDDSGTQDGGGLAFHGSANVTIHGTIVAGNFRGAAYTPDDVEQIRNLSTPSSFNLIGNASTAGGLTDGQNGNIVGSGGTGRLPLSNILDATLTNNGGPSRTHNLLSGSPAIDAGAPPIPANPTISWSFEETAGTTASDSAGPDDELLNHQNGVLIGQSGANASTGLALEFDGTDDRSRTATPVPNSAFGGDSYSISLWFRADATTPNQMLFSVTDPAADDEHVAFVMLKDGQVRFTNRIPAGLGGGDDLRAGSFTQGTWHHVIAIRDQNEMALYLDGQLVGTLSGATGVLPMTGLDISLGRNGTRPGVQQFPLTGAIDEVRVYNEALSFDQRGTGFARLIDGDNDGTPRVDIGALETNRHPVLDLNGAANGIDFDAGSYTELDPARVIVDPELSVASLSGSMVISATATFPGATTEDLLDVTIPGGITAITKSYDTTTGTLTLSGADSAENYQSVLRTLNFSSSANFGGTSAATIPVTVTESGNLTSATANILLGLAGFDFMPVLDLNGPDPETGVNNAATFTVGGGAVNLVQEDATLTDRDDTTTTTMKITLDSPSATESLSLTGTAPSELTVIAYDSTTGVLEVNGTALLDAYRDLLRTLQYDDTNATPSETTRIVTVDLGAPVLPGSGFATAEVTISVGPAPALSVNIAAASIAEGGVVTTGTVSRSGPTTGALNVNLTSDKADATVPATVTIAADETTSPPFEITPFDDTSVDGTQTVTITASATGLTSGTDTVDVTDNDSAPAIPGNVDGDGDFDANDSFLIHLVQLSGGNPQIDQAKGISQLSAEDIRGIISGLTTVGDVDGDGDFDANDSFLIHLIKLSGSNDQINQAKGTSQLTADQIRANVRALEGSGATQASRSASRAISLDERGADQLFSDESIDDVPVVPVRSDASTSVLPDKLFQDYRSWIDRL